MDGNKVGPCCACKKLAAQLLAKSNQMDRTS